MPVSERINQILLFFDDHVQLPDHGIAINPDPRDAQNPDDKAKLFYQLLAHSESVGWQDLRFMLDHLEKRQLIRKTLDVSQQCNYVLEVPGFECIEELRKVAPDFDQVFVAMWFDESLNPAYKHGFKQAIDDAGYQAVRIDQGQPFHDKICDKIIREIRRSRFVVADFSKGSDGARGNVYYEAGFAHGLGRRVIFTCREKDENDIQFHTRQYPHILWKNENDLREQLQERITALMGEGPRKSRG